jgi:hypothetical protein
MYDLLSHPYGGVMTIASDFSALLGIVFFSLFFLSFSMRRAGLFGVIAYGEAYITF